jgi:hypothetical protein
VPDSPAALAIGAAEATWGAPFDRQLLDLRFLRLKLDLSKRRFLDGLRDYQNELALETAHPTLASELVLVPGDTMAVQRRIQSLPSVHPFLMDLDTILGDARRLMEFALRLRADRDGVPHGNFEFQKFLNQLRDDYPESRSALAAAIRSRYPEVLAYVRENDGLLRRLEGARTDLTHYEAASVVENAQVRLRVERAASAGPEHHILDALSLTVLGDDPARWVVRAIAVADGLVARLLA